MSELALGMMAGSTIAGMKGTLEEGKHAEEIAKARAAIDIKNAEAVRDASVEKARLQKEKGRRLLATQKSQAAAGNIRTNVGAPLVIEAQTRADIAKDVGYILETGREEADFYRSRAALEIATGKALRRKSKYSALSQGLGGFGRIAIMGQDAGIWKKMGAEIKSRGAKTPLSPTANAILLRY